MNQELTNLLEQFVEKLKSEVIQEVKRELQTTSRIEAPATVEQESAQNPANSQTPEAPAVPVTPVTNVIAIDKSLFPESLHPVLALLDGEDWPEAAPQFLICEDSEEDKMERAEGILDYIGDNLQGKKVLDFGCGEGHVAIKAADTASVAVGYDIAEPTAKTEKENCILTTDFSKVTENGPYDLVILYDVLDHCKDPVAALKQVKEVISPTTKVFVRCHSWMSRHGSHIYKQLNKAWAHLIFSEEDFAKMGVKMEFVQKYYFPLNIHNQWFAGAGFKIVSSDIIKTAVEPFFRKPELASILSKPFKGEFPDWQMSQVFNDYNISL